MSTSTKTTPGQSAVDRVMIDLDQVHAAAEEILWILKPGEIPNSTQRKILKLADIENRDAVERELARVAGVRRRLSESGSNSEFAAAEKAVVLAVRNEREKVPALQQQFDNIQRQIDELVRARESAKDTLAKFTQAREALRTPRMLPGHIRDAYEADVHAVGQTHHVRINELEQELSVLECLKNIDLTTTAGQRLAQLHCETAQPNLISRQVHDPNARLNADGTVLDSPCITSVTFNTDGFRTYREKRLKERPKLERELQGLQEERDAAVARVGALLDYYVSRIT